MSWCLWLVLLVAPIESATFSIYPSVALAPLDTLRLTARIPVREDNRRFCVAAWLEGVLTRRSCEPLDDEAITHVVEWRDLREPGEYTVTLDIYRVGGSERLTRRLDLR